MRKLLTLTATMFTVTYSAALAAEYKFATLTIPTPTTSLVASVQRVCESSLIMSDNAKLACIKSAMPRLTKDGAAFINTGLGAEFNTLIRQVQ